MPQTTLAPARSGTLPPLVSGALPLVGHATQFLRDQLQLLERGYREHGEIFRLRLGRRPAIIMVGPELARWVFKHTDDHTLSIGPSLAFTIRLFGPDFYFLAPPEEYQHQRETLLPLFRAHMAGGHLAIMERHCAAFVARLGDSGTFDLPQEMNALVLGIIMEAFLGADFVRHMPPTVASDFRDFIRGLDPITPGWVPAPHLLRARRARDRMRAAVGDLVQARHRQPADPPDFLQVLMSARALDGTPVTDQWVIQMALGVTFAGHDSTTGHVSWSLIDLLQHPDELAKVLAEQSRIFADGTGTSLDLVAVHRMNCLDRALHETARLRPVAPVMLRRVLRPVDIRGLVIPAGADVFVAPVLSHRLPVLFDHADQYHPDRFLANARQTSYLHGFGGGTHRCLGEHFADLLTHVTVTRLLQHYELTLVSPQPVPVRTPAFKGPRSPCLIIWLGSRDLNSVGDLFAGTRVLQTRINAFTGEKRRADRSIRLGGRLAAGGHMAGEAGAACAPSGATALLASAISYALGACMQVAPREMALPTPCADWDLAALLDHLAASMADLEAAIRTGHLDLDPNESGHPAAPGLEGGDPAEGLREQAANLLFACYAHHGPDRFVLVGGLPLPAGIVACTGAVEIAVHGWDVSAARGRGSPIPPGLATPMLRLSPLLVTGREGLFGAPVQVPVQASPSDRLVAYLGRIPYNPVAPP